MIRLRRNRQQPWSRALTQETRLSVENLIWPVFVHDGSQGPEDQIIPSMPGVFRYSKNSLIENIKIASDLGIPAVAIFPHISASKKDEKGSEALNPNNLVCETVNLIKSKVPNIGLICDVALDPYTTHGHDGIVEDGKILNDATVEILCQQAVNQAKAGADVLAPSDMMDLRVGEIRKALDLKGFQDKIILSYAAKYASAFYGPFRDAVGSSSLTGADKKLGFRDKSTYQMNPANSDEALREVELDLSEGADMVMVKPGLAYLDIIYRIKSKFGVPTFAYQVSGEYSSLMSAAENGWVDKNRIFMETLVSFKRAGADGILTYFAIEAAKILRG